MNNRLLLSRLLLLGGVIALLFASPPLLPGATNLVEATPLTSEGDWHAKTLGGALVLTAVFGLVGVVLAFIGYKFFDICTPGDMHKEIFENRNVAAAIVAAAVILGICLIIAAAMG